MTKIYGSSDDLVEFEGDFTGEVGRYGTDDRDNGVLIFVSDGTILEAKYGKCGAGIWGINLIKDGSLLVNISQCTDEEAKIHSDIAVFTEGVKWAYAATEWERVS